MHGTRARIMALPTPPIGAWCLKACRRPVLQVCCLQYQLMNVGDNTDRRGRCTQLGSVIVLAHSFPVQDIVECRITTFRQHAQGYSTRFKMCSCRSRPAASMTNRVDGNNRTAMTNRVGRNIHTLRTATAMNEMIHVRWNTTAKTGCSIHFPIVYTKKSLHMYAVHSGQNIRAR